MQDFSKLIQTIREDTEQLEQERARADAIFLSIGDGAIVTDEMGNISRVNHAFQELLGYEPDEILGKWYPKTIIAVNDKGEELPTMERAISKALLAGKPATGKYFFRHKDGTPIPCAVTASPILMGTRPIGTVQIFKDMTLEFEIDRMKSEFIAIASHQLRTPLTSITTNAHMLAEGYAGTLSENQQAFMDNIVYSSDRMQELISTLLNITRIEAGKIAVNPVPTDLFQLAEEINSELQPRIAQKKQKLNAKLKTHKPIETDPLLLREVMANLLSNAVKYTPEGGKITVSLIEEKDSITYSVKDTGYGIPTAESNKIFTKFFRANNIVSKENVGTGLGLYMVKGIADNLGAKLWFESKENVGTTFNFSLPKKGSPQKHGSSTLETTNHS